MKTIAILLALAFVTLPALASSVDGVNTVVDMIVKNRFVDEDLSAAPMTSSMSKFAQDNPDDGLPPENMTKPPMQYVGSSVEFAPPVLKSYTPAELADLQKNNPDWKAVLLA
jgi:hypothetical protein